MHRLTDAPQSADFKYKYESHRYGPQSVRGMALFGDMGAKRSRSRETNESAKLEERVSRARLVIVYVYVYTCTCTFPWRRWTV